MSKCMLCESQPVSWKCSQCDPNGMLLCDGCDADMHSTKKTQSHSRSPISNQIGAPTSTETLSLSNSGPSSSGQLSSLAMCMVCESQPAAVHCGACEASNSQLCVDCDAAMHATKKGASHQRTPLVSNPNVTTPIQPPDSATTSAHAASLSSNISASSTSPITPAALNRPTSAKPPSANAVSEATSNSASISSISSSTAAPASAAAPHFLLVVKCSLCESSPASIRCAQCDPPLLCSECDQAMHRTKKSAEHQRAALTHDGGVSKQFLPSVQPSVMFAPANMVNTAPRCMLCESQPAAVRCLQCDPPVNLLCSECDQAMHASGNKKTAHHQRVPDLMGAQPQASSAATAAALNAAPMPQPSSHSAAATTSAASSSSSAVPLPSSTASLSSSKAHADSFKAIHVNEPSASSPSSNNSANPKTPTSTAAQKPTTVPTSSNLNTPPQHRPQSANGSRSSKIVLTPGSQYNPTSKEMKLCSQLFEVLDELELAEDYAHVFAGEEIMLSDALLLSESELTSLIPKLGPRKRLFATFQQMKQDKQQQQQQQSSSSSRASPLPRSSSFQRSPPAQHSISMDRSRSPNYAMVPQQQQSSPSSFTASHQSSHQRTLSSSSSTSTLKSALKRPASAKTPSSSISSSASHRLHTNANAQTSSALVVSSSPASIPSSAIDALDLSRAVPIKRVNGSTSAMKPARPTSSSSSRGKRGALDSGMSSKRSTSPVVICREFVQMHYPTSPAFFRPDRPKSGSRSSSSASSSDLRLSSSTALMSLADHDADEEELLNQLIPVISDEYNSSYQAPTHSSLSRSNSARSVRSSSVSSSSSSRRGSPEPWRPASATSFFNYDSMSSSSSSSISRPQSAKSTLSASSSSSSLFEKPASVQLSKYQLYKRVGSPGVIRIRPQSAAERVMFPSDRQGRQRNERENSSNLFKIRPRFGSPDACLNCTFEPAIANSTIDQFSDAAPISERLVKQIEEFRHKKVAPEPVDKMSGSQHCTFEPDLPEHVKNMKPAKPFLERVQERVVRSREAEERNKNQMLKALTFQPFAETEQKKYSLGADAKGSSSDKHEKLSVNDFINRYQDDLESRKTRLKKAVSGTLLKVPECTFTPVMNENSLKLGASVKGDFVERMFEDFENRVERQREAEAEKRRQAKAMCKLTLIGQESIKKVPAFAGRY